LAETQDIMAAASASEKYVQVLPSAIQPDWLNLSPIFWTYQLIEDYLWCLTGTALCLVCSAP